MVQHHRPEADREWAAIHAVVFNLAGVLFDGAISGQLPAPFLSPGQLRRWNHATTEHRARAECPHRWADTVYRSERASCVVTRKP
ncbi:hypothetical protein JCM33774_30200 [Actinophytocola sp. KF-1]